MKKLIMFIWNWIVGLFKTKPVEVEKVEPKTVEEKIEEKKVIRHRRLHVPPHNNRKSGKNKRGKRSRMFVQYIPGGKAIYHEPKL